MTKRGIISITIVLGFTIAALVATLIVFIATTSTYETQLENLYMRSFYELSSNVNDLELNISKLIATNQTESQKVVLTDIYNICNIANTNISNMPVSNQNTKDINNFVNKLGGFSYSLLTKINNGQTWSETDLNSINELHTYSLNIMYEFNNYINTFTFNYSMLNQIDYNNEKGSPLNATFENIQGTASKVPTLIYDGPFAESVLNPSINGLPTEEVTKEQAQAVVENLLKYYNIEKVKFVNETNGQFYTYNFQVTTDNLNLFVQVARRGGFVLEINSNGSGGDQNLTVGQCDELAQTFARSLELNNVYSVWHTVNGNIAYVNLAPIVNGVIYYPDLIKVKIDRKLGLVTGWEAKNYAYNYNLRTVETSSLTLNQAQQKLSPLLTVVERNRTVIPLEFGGETYAYEFICTWKDYTYYVYLDAKTGEEVNILRIIKTTSGDLIL